MRFGFSPARFAAIVAKEFVQMRRDRLTFAMVLGIPVLQLVLFGFAIDTDPHHLPTAALLEDDGALVRDLVAAMDNSGYFDFTHWPETEVEAERLLEAGDVQFVLHVPLDFTRAVVRGDRPAVLLVADATDPSATSHALGALDGILARVLGRAGLADTGPAGPGPAGAAPPAAEVVVHAAYNPERITRHNIVPGLMGVVLTMTLVLITALAITRERERGTLENLLATPVRPAEVTLGKIVPYILVGYLQAGLILVAARLLFDVPMLGSVPMLLAVTFVFVVANLAMGMTFSTIARNQLQAVQMGVFFFLPSMLLSGFMFPFRGMPGWARAVGEVLPLTHYLRIVRGVLLKGSGFAVVAPEILPMAAFAVVVTAVALLRFRRTLD